MPLETPCWGGFHRLCQTSEELHGTHQLTNTILQTVKPTTMTTAPSNGALATKALARRLSHSHLSATFHSQGFRYQVFS